MEYSAEFKLDQIAFPSFTSQASFRLQYSASDTVNALVGLLEANAAREGETVDWKANFYRAVDALGMKKPDLFAIGMEQCQRQHGAILRQVESVIEGTNGVRVTGAFRYVVIKDHPDQAYFVHPAILQHLGNYLMDYWRFNPSGKKKALPLVLCAQNSTIEEFIVVGIWNSPSRGEGKVVPNEFGKFFEIATEDMGARATLTAFDTSVMQIKSDDLNKFLMQLTQTIKTSGARAGRL
jgi:cell division control protein 45